MRARPKDNASNSQATAAINSSLRTSAQFPLCFPLNPSSWTQIARRLRQEGPSPPLRRPAARPRGTLIWGYQSNEGRFRLPFELDAAAASGSATGRSVQWAHWEVGRDWSLVPPAMAFAVSELKLWVLGPKYPYVTPWFLNYYAHNLGV
jgi:hypothetical protein